jgi:hypothetical protein
MADFLISTFTLSNPATENPRTITALTILGRSADRSRSELRGQPGIQARLLTSIVQAYNNLGLLKEAHAAMEPSLVTIGCSRDQPQSLRPPLRLALRQFVEPKSRQRRQQLEERQPPPAFRRSAAIGAAATSDSDPSAAKLKRNAGGKHS